MPKIKNENQRPAWAQNMDQEQWKKSKAPTDSEIESNTEIENLPTVSNNNIQRR